MGFCWGRKCRNLNIFHKGFIIIIAIFSINKLASWLHCKPEGEGAVWDGHTLDPHSLATPPDVDKILHLKTEMSNKKEKSFYLTETLVMLCGLLTSFCRLRTEPDPKTAILINSWQSFSFQHLLTWESDFGGDTKWSLTVFRFSFFKNIQLFSKFLQGSRYWVLLLPWKITRTSLTCCAISCMNCKKLRKGCHRPPKAHFFLTLFKKGGGLNPC